MGNYDTLGSIQLKCGNCEYENYNIGDTVPFADGVYVGYGGCAVVVGGKFVAEFPSLIDKYGGVIDTSPLIDASNPIAQAVKLYDKPYL